ncbi:unnamed protein product [Orchesella dallaii]|uniref:Peptidase S1 domain-containing protein n=1 Tax=Orchesella dallaii TaxID=48710 RepID=A0ABP1Q8Q5_9HEXA
MNRADVNRLRLQIGDYNIYSTSDGQHQNRGASNVYYHRGFSMRTLYDDVAVIRLANPVSYNRNVQPICLSTNTNALENSVASVAGWGQLSDRGGTQSSILRTVGVRVWRHNDCVNTYKGRAPAGITNGMVCAGGSGYDSCKGDSGGPLSVTRNSRAEQIGIALDDEQEVTTLAPEDLTDSLPDGSKSRQQLPENYCVTNTGLSGTCETVQECFPRLFPPRTPGDNSDDDTPGQTGVYNQVLVKWLIEAAGFCRNSARANPDDSSSIRSTEKVCCATSKVSDTYPVEEQSNDTSTIDGDLAKKPCGYIKIDPKTLPDRIVGGRPAVSGEFPWQVAMIRRGQQFCGASLLDSKNVLTAAHCVEFMTQGDVKALRLNMGDLVLNTQSDGQHVERKAKRVLYHKGFSMKNLAHDIALIHLDRPVEFSKTVQPVCLHPGNPAYDTGASDADVSGWGTTSSGGSQSQRLLAVQLRIITQSDCNQKYSKAGKSVGPGMVCAGSPGKDSCQGDSGGPLVMDSRGQAKQVGIVSWGCASYPGVYRRSVFQIGNMKLCLLALAGLLFVGLAAAGTWMDEDTVIIDPFTPDTDTSSRLKRDEGVQELRVDEEDTVLIRSERCLTTKGRSGQCMSLRECFPLLFPIDPDVNMPPDMTLSDPLADQLIAASGFCGGGEYKSDSPSLFAQVVRAEVLVCCAIQSRIPTPLPPRQTNATLQNINPSRANCGTIKIDPKLLPQALDGTGGKIVGGRPAQKGEFPWIVALMSSNKQFCGGSLIDSQTVLTAAHCVQHMGAEETSKLTIQIGDHNIYSTSDGPHEVRTASRILYHRGFSMQHLHHDIALIHLARPVSNSKYVQTVCLHPGSPSYDNVYGDVAGWGQLRDNGPQPSTLQTASVKIWSHAECKQKYDGHAPAGIGEGMVCSGGSGKDSCRGDSGGPLTINSRSQAMEVGIVSFGIGCGSFPGVYTRVDRYLAWVSKNRKRSYYD